MRSRTEPWGRTTFKEKLEEEDSVKEAGNERPEKYVHNWNSEVSKMVREPFN